MTDVKIYTTDLVKNINLEIRSSDETEIANEPQTIFGKLAKKLKTDQIMAELNSLSSRS